MRGLGAELEFETSRTALRVATSAGGGTYYGTGGRMLAPTEYLHAAQLSVDRYGLRFQVIDTNGRVRK